MNRKPRKMAIHSMNTNYMNYYLFIPLDIIYSDSSFKYIHLDYIICSYQLRSSGSGTDFMKCEIFFHGNTFLNWCFVYNSFMATIIMIFYESMRLCDSEFKKFANFKTEFNYLQCGWLTEWELSICP